jgi:hypothetical protein
MVFEDNNRLEASGFHLAAQGLEIEGAFTHRLMQILKTVVVVKVQFEKPIREGIQPLGESYLGKEEKMADIQAKSQIFTEFFPQFDQVVRPCVKNIFEADPGIDPACRFEEFAPNLETVLQPQLLTECEPELVETRVKHDLARLDPFGQFHDLGKAEPGDLQDPGIESAGGEVGKGGVEGESLTILPPFDHGGNLIFGDGIEEFGGKVDLGEKAVAVQKLQVLVKILQAALAI